MKKSILSLSLLLFSVTLPAQELTEESDSLSHELEEITVSAAPVVRKADRAIYSIDNSVKERSSSTLSLLRNIQIPQLNINEVMETVTSSLGNVQIRVNGREISVDKLKTINPENVQKIEWIDNPGLRYGTDVGAVINLIVKNPTFGGSFMFDTQEALTVGFNNTNANLTLNSGASQWNINGSFSLRNKVDFYREYTDSYKLPDGSVMERTQQPLDSYFDQVQTTPGISYNYTKSDSINFYVGLFFINRTKQHNEYNGRVISNISRGEETLLLTEGLSNPSKYPWLNVYWEQKFRNSQTVIFNAVAQHVSEKSNRYYREIDEASMDELVNIDNNIRSRNWYYSFEGNYIKEFGRAGQITAGIRYNGNKINSTYLNYDDQTINQTTNRVYFFGEYMVTLKKFTFTAGIGGTWNETHLKDGEDRESQIDFTPRLSVNWRASDKSRWTMIYGNSLNTPSASSLSPITQAIDGIQIERGNPYLKSYLFHSLSLRYNFSNNKNLNISARGNYYHASNPIQTYYTWENDKILRTYSNSGFYNELYANLSASYQPLPDWLSLSADLHFVHAWNRGTGFNHKLNSFGQSLNITAFHWNWELTFQLYNPCKDLWNETITRGEVFNLIGLGYRWKGWKFTLAMMMPFGRYSQSEWVISDIVKQNTVNRSNKFCHMPVLRITYNVNWGHQKRTAQRKLSGNTEGGGGAQAAGR